MRRLLARFWRFLCRIYVRHDILHLELMIAEEERRNREFPARMCSWRQELARRRGDLALLDRDRRHASLLLSGLRSPWRTR